MANITKNSTPPSQNAVNQTVVNISAPNIHYELTNSSQTSAECTAFSRYGAQQVSTFANPTACSTSSTSATGNNTQEFTIVVSQVRACF